MAHPNEDLVREGFAAFGRGELDALRKRFWADDIRYHIPGRSPLAGDYEGTEQVIQFFARAFELTGGTFSAELHDVVANDEHAVALLTLRGERAGKQLNDNTAETIHFRDGKVSEVWFQQTDLYAVDEFFS
jgi:ketosteroid isomerase-like protein